jgi:hypothetical protein
MIQKLWLDSFQEPGANWQKLTPFYGRLLNATRILSKTLESRPIGMKALPKLSTFTFAAIIELERALSWIVTWNTQNLKNPSPLAHREESVPDNAEVKEILFLLKIFQKNTEI